MQILNSAAAAIVIAAFSLVTALGSGPRAHAQTGEGDHAAFRQIIAGQIEAFRADDGPRAFSFAAPALQQQVTGPDMFMKLVRKGYPAIFLPQKFTFGVVTDELGRPTQRVNLIGPHGRPWLALYGFDRHTDGSWRIAGVILRPGAAGQTAEVAEPVVARQQLVATLAPQAQGSQPGDTQFVAAYDTGTKQLQVIRVAGAAPVDKDFELWLIVGDKAPVSLGLVSAVANSTTSVPDKLQAALAEGAKLAVSVEPKGGSTTGAPTGPVVALGPVKKI